MYTLLLVVIYLAFISLGLPDSLLGAAWPVLYRELEVPIAYAGILTFIISCGTVCSSLLSDRVTRRFGTGLTTAFSVFLTMAALFGFSCSGSFWLLCLWAVPYGLGAGAVDAALNNYVALHYPQRQMHWLHCFWGVGVSISPYLMSAALTGGAGWTGGYRSVAWLQAGLTAILFCSLPLWRRPPTAPAGAAADGTQPTGLWGTLKLPGVKEVLAGFFGYCALESSTGLWASSYLVLHRGVPEVEAARWASLFFLGITGGRFFSGVIAGLLSDRNLVRIGLGVIFLGILTVWLPAPSPVPLLGLVVIGLGCAPVYPAIIHETPANFGAENSQRVIGLQMAGAYVGTTVMPPLFGVVAEYAGIGWYPVWQLLILILMTLMLERKNRRVRTARTVETPSTQGVQS